MGLEIIKPDVNINFVRLRPIALTISGLLILLGLISLIVKGGPRYGIDFAGGTIIQIKFQKEVKADAIRQVLKQLNIKDALVQRFGPASNHEYLIRTQVTSDALKRLAERIKEAFEKQMGQGSIEIRRVEMVGPKVGKDLREKALLALFYAILAIGVYISGRFEMRWGTSGIIAAILLALVYVFSLFKVPLTLLVITAFIATLALYVVFNLRFALGAIIALIHDVSITVGVFSLLNKEFNLLIVAALLTIVGYSLNDTIVVFDRIRENMRKSDKTDLANLINRSINETLSRTILTSGTTLLALFSLFFFGGSVIHDFAFAMLVGVTVGTYSSIFIASPILTWLEGKHFILKTSTRRG